MDAGLACRELERRLRNFGIRPSSVDAVLVSHEHGDHARGALQFTRRHQAALCSTEGTFRFLPRRKQHRKIEWQTIRSGRSFKVGRLTVEPFATPHDAAEPVGFRFERGSLCFTHITDIGHMNRLVEEAIDGAQVALLESNHDVDMLRRGPYPETLKHRVGGRLGHLSNEALARYLEARLPETVRHLFLAHLSQTNNHHTIAMASCRTALARRGGRTPAVHLTFQDRPTRILRVGEPRKIEVPEHQGVLSF